MAFIQDHRLIKLKESVLNEPITLGKMYKARKSEFMHLSVLHSMLENYLLDGWEVERVLKTKTRIRKPKEHDKNFEDDIWCQMYELGYRKLNVDENLNLPFGKDELENKQIDVLAINDETALIIECKSSIKAKGAPSYKDEFELLGLRIDGFTKAIHQAFGSHLKVKYIFATRNIRFDSSSDDMTRLLSTSSYYYSDNSYKYVNNLIKNYKKAANYQFTGLIFRNQTINKNRIEIPALEGKMGEKTYYMFSIEPETLLKMGFILHRTRTNEEDMPNYQRLLVPSRLKGITKFINDGGYFPNSIIVNFNQKKHKLQFEPGSKAKNSDAKHGILKIPNAYAIAYLIDGQHRLYGYANSDYKETNTIPVVAFVDLEPEEQLKIFSDVNENQKAVSASLRLMLDEDLNWNSSRTDSRLNALRASIIRDLSESATSPLYDLIEIGADPAPLSAKPFNKAMLDSGLFPKAKGNKYIEDSIVGSLYNVNNLDHNKEMIATKKKVFNLICKCYEFAQVKYSKIYNREKYFINSNRGTYAFIALIGSLNKHLTVIGNVSRTTTLPKRFEELEKYLYALFESIGELKSNEEERQLTALGSTVEVKWLRFFQSLINSKFKDYEPIELIDWRERQDDALQEEGRKYGVEIEREMKNIVIKKLIILFDTNWDLEIGSIQRECQSRANSEVEKQYKETGTRPDIPWTDMFTINDYKTIIKKFWTKKPEIIADDEASDFSTFEDDFSINIGEEKFNSQSEKTKWISYFNSYRNCWAHEGTKSKRLNKFEVDHLSLFHQHFDKRL